MRDPFSSYRAVAPGFNRVSAAGVIRHALTTFSRSCLAACLLAALALSIPTTVSGQQFVVDDVGIVDYRACQIEAWHGEQSTWILPACQPVRNLELTVGLGRLVTENETWDPEYVVQGKYLLRPDRADGVGVSLVVGAGISPIRQPGGRRVTDLFAYVPATMSLAGDRLLIHPNLGWLLERERGEEEGGVRHILTWGMRGDVALLERLEAIGELYGEGSEGLGWQTGLRVHLVPDRLLVDLSYGNHFDVDDPGTGFTVGFAWTPPAFN